MLTLERLEDNDLPLPQYGTEQSAGIDFGACLTRQCYYSYNNEKSTAPDKWFDKTSDILKLHLPANMVVMIPLGFKCSFETLQQSVLQLHVRSSSWNKGFMLANTTGIVDQDYRGELFITVRNLGHNDLIIEHGQKIVQGVITPIYRPQIKEGIVDKTTRGDKGFGSTGNTVIT